MKNKAGGVHKSWFLRQEEGQSMVEFALLLPVLFILFMLPMEFYRYMHMKMELDSAVSSCLAELDYNDVQASGIENKIIREVSSAYGSQFNMADLSLDKLSVGKKTKTDYMYYVYSSDKAKNGFADRFDARPSNYQCREVKLKMAYHMRPLTPLGALFLGNSYTISSREYCRDIYVGGYE